MERINLRDASRKYRQPVEIETALAWNAVKKFLDSQEKSVLFAEIAAIAITEKNITLYVRRSVARAEFSLLKEPLEKAVKSVLSDAYDSHERAFKIL